MRHVVYCIIAFTLFACKNQTNSKQEGHSSINSAKSINEQTFIKLGGEDQYVEITGKSDKNPVLLFIHGGPGWPQTPHLRYFNADLATQLYW